MARGGDGRCMPGKIFISYRRDDVAGDARGLRDGLAARFGQRNVFMDIDNLLPGQRFDRKLAEALSACNVLIAVIGPRWLELLGAKTARGEPDYVRAEIGEALRRGIVVIPVRVGLDGRMPELPRREDLPADIRNLVLHQKHDVVHEHFGRDLAALAKAIVAVRRERREAGTGIPVALDGGRRGCCRRGLHCTLSCGIRETGRRDGEKAAQGGHRAGATEAGGSTRANVTPSVEGGTEGG